MTTTEIGLDPIQSQIISPRQAEPRPLHYWTWWLPLFAIGWLIVFINAFPQPLELAQHNWLLFLVGFAGAAIGNATAVGGGLVFIPVMIFVYQLSPVAALKLTIATQAFGMTSGAIGWLRRGVVSLEALWVTIPALLIGSAISTLIIPPNSLLVKGLFGPVSILIGILTLFMLERHGTFNRISTRILWPLFFMSLIGGLITGWIAIGQGQVIAAFLMLVCYLRADRSIGLGVVLLAVNSIFLVILHNFVLGGVPWEMAAFTILGCVFGARLGPYLAQWISLRNLKIGFATIAIIDGGIFTLQFLLAAVK